MWTPWKRRAVRGRGVFWPKFVDGRKEVEVLKEEEEEGKKEKGHPPNNIVGESMTSLTTSCKSYWKKKTVEDSKQDYWRHSRAASAKEEGLRVLQKKRRS